MGWCGSCAPQLYTEMHSMLQQTAGRVCLVAVLCNCRVAVVGHGCRMLLCMLWPGLYLLYCCAAVGIVQAPDLHCLTARATGCSLGSCLTAKGIRSVATGPVQGQVLHWYRLGD
jgi:hypothetical protein